MKLELKLNGPREKFGYIDEGYKGNNDTHKSVSWYGIITQGVVITLHM